MNKLQEDNAWVGAGVSLFVTVTVFYILYTINNDLAGSITINGKTFTGVSERLISSTAVVANVIPFVIYIRAKKDNAMKGVGFIAVLLALFLMVYYYALHKTSLLP